MNDEKDEIVVIEIKGECVAWYQKESTNERCSTAKGDDDLLRVQIIGFIV